MAQPIKYLATQTTDDFGHKFSFLKYSVALAPATDTVMTIPGDAPKYKALIKAAQGENVFVALNQAAEPPAGPAFTATTSELITINGICREVNAGDQLHFITRNSTITVSVVLYAIYPNN